MSHVFQIPDDLYTQLATYAAQHNQTPETLFLAWAKEVAHEQEGSATKKGQALENIEQASIKAQDKHEDETLNSPLLQVAGIFAINEAGWADKHDQYLAEGYMEDHAKEK